MLPELLDPQGFRPLFGDGRAFRESHETVMERKYNDCHPDFIAHLLAEGIRTPVHLRPIGNSDAGKDWVLLNGHHRWAVAERHGLLVPWVDNGPESWDNQGGTLPESQTGRPDVW